MNRVAVVVQARMTSTRLPGKVLLSLSGKSVLQHHLDRLTTSGLNTIVATTSESSDDPIVEFCAAKGIQYVRGSEQDVLSRYALAASNYDLDMIVRTTSDCPLIDGQLVAAAVDEYARADEPWLYLSNTLERTYPRGLDFEIFSRTMLDVASTSATTSSQREHVTPYFYTGVDSRIRTRSFKAAVDNSDIRMTLDTPEDYQFFATLFARYQGNLQETASIVDFLRNHPEITSINQDIVQKSI